MYVHSMRICRHTLWRRLHGAREARAPHFYKWLGAGGTMSRRRAKKKLSKLHWLSRTRSPKRLIVLLEPKKWRGTTKKNFYQKSAGSVPPLSLRTGAPHTFKFVLAPLQTYQWWLWESGLVINLIRWSAGDRYRGKDPQVAGTSVILDKREYMNLTTGDWVRY